MSRVQLILRPRRPFVPFSLAALALLALGLAACGDDDNTAASVTAAPGTPDFRTATPGGSAEAASPGTTAGASAVAGQQAPAGALTISTPDDIHYDKQELDASAGLPVTVQYTNNSDITHNIHFYSGADASSLSLGATPIGAGPGNTQTVTFMAPSAPGSYLFRCDVHPDQMVGHLVVK